MSIIVTQDPFYATQLVKRQARRLFHYQFDSRSDDLATLLERLPIRHKMDLISYGDDHHDEALETAILFSETSGTTGHPLQTPRGLQDLSWNVLNQIAAYKKRVQPGIDRVAILHPSVLSPFVEASAMALKALGVGYVRLFPIPKVCEYERMYEVLDRYAITTVMSTPTLIYKVLYELQRLHRGRLPAALKKMLVTGERFLPASARNMERILGAESIAQPFVYGSSETATLMQGCFDGGYRPITEDFLFEVLVEEDSRSSVNPTLGDWTPRGPLIVTWLRDGMLPILRYHTGDWFTLRQESSSGEYIFTFEGRNDSDGFDLSIQQKIEATLFSLSFPIFHFECQLNTNQTRLLIDVASLELEQRAQIEAENAVMEAIDERWPVDVTLNRATLSFFNFSPSPKTRKFIS